jgi:hypothetical protein
MADSAGSSNNNSGESKGRFEPKTAVTLAPPKDDPITLEHLTKCDGTHMIPVFPAAWSRLVVFCSKRQPHRSLHSLDSEKLWYWLGLIGSFAYRRYNCGEMSLLTAGLWECLEEEKMAWNELI